jgi:hypothetical protein
MKEHSLQEEDLLDQNCLKHGGQIESRHLHLHLRLV